MHEPDFLLFASDATLAVLLGAALLLVSIAAMVGERRRLRRKHIDAVGWVPWTTLSVLTLFVGFSLLALGVTGWLQG